MPQINIRWSDNTLELRQHLKQGIDSIEAMKSAVDKTARSLGGEGLLRAAHNLTAAITELGGATKLTAQEQERALGTLDKAIAKYKVLGQQAPTDMRKLADELRPQSSLLQGITDKLGPLASGLGLAFSGTAILGGIVAIGKAAIADADALEKMKDKTGIGVEALQRLRSVGDEAGNTLDEMTSAVNRFQRNLVEGKADEALGKLGLQIANIKALAPDQQFLAIGAALEKVTDPAQRASLAIELFGKSGTEILPSLLHASRDLQDGVMVMSADSVEALDKVGDAWSRLWRNTKVVIGEMAASVIKVPSLMGQLAGGGTPGPDTLPEDVTIGNRLSQMDPADIAAIQAPLLKLAESGHALTISDEEAADAIKLMNAELAISIPINQKAQEELRKSAAAAKAFADAAHGLSFKKFVDDGIPLVGTLQGLSGNTNDWRGQLDDLSGTLNEFHHGLTVAGDDMTTVLIPAFGKLPNVIPAGTAAIEDAMEATEKWGNVFKKFPDLLTQAFTGGGGLSGALKGFSNEITKSLFGEKGPLEGITKSLASGVTGATGFLGGTVSKLFGNIAGSLLPGLGGLLSAGIGALGKLLSGIGGPSKEQQAARGSQADLVKQLQAMATESQKTEGALKDTYHTIAIVARDAFLSVGQSAQEADQHIKDLLNTNDPAAFARGMQALTDAMAKQKEIAASVDAVSTAWQKAGTVIPASMQETIRNLIKMNGLTDAQRQKLQGLLDSAKPDFQALTSEAAGLGVSLEALGPKVEQGDLDGRVQKVTDFIERAKQAGADLGGVLAGTADEFSGFVQEAKKFGTALPESTREYIDELIRAGKLLDENGQKIEDVGDINFEATPLNKGLEDLNDTLKQLVETLNRLDGKKINTTVNTDYTTSGIPQAPPSPGGYSDESFQADFGYAARGGLVTRLGVMPFPTGAQYLATGGPVWPFIPRGTDTVPAMLSPGEVVIPKGRGAGGPTVVLNEYFNFDWSGSQFIDGADLEVFVEKKAMPRIVNQIEDRRRGYAGRIARVIEDING